MKPVFWFVIFISTDQSISFVVLVLIFVVKIAIGCARPRLLHFVLWFHILLSKKRSQMASWRKPRMTPTAPKRLFKMTTDGKFTTTRQPLTIYNYNLRINNKSKPISSYNRAKIARPWTPTKQYAADPGRQHESDKPNYRTFSNSTNEAECIQGHPQLPPHGPQNDWPKENSREISQITGTRTNDYDPIYHPAYDDQFLHHEIL